ncbi:28S ribosomal protein S9-like 1 [Homarus americanus]|uniref:28S ribosomal protein S9-like 1 n=1 Tax=Homarus americanus TaxID=6706 RepID=A0A8J5K7H0_HOMAM|nr:28S ribosomal protein S9-like 1 [Homarus americanus]
MILIVQYPKHVGLKTWKEVTVRCLCAAWRPLWPECALQRDFEGFEELEEEAVVHEIVSLGNSMGLEVDDDDDVEELVEEHSKELSTEELLELHKEQNETLKRSLTSEESGEDEDKEESLIIPAKDLKDALFCWSKLSKLAEDYHPDVGSVQKAISVFNDNVMNYFWKLMFTAEGTPYIATTGGRKQSKASVTVFGRGSGKISINGEGVLYFKNIQDREQAPSEVFCWLSFKALIFSPNHCYSLKG